MCDSHIVNNNIILPHLPESRIRKLDNDIQVFDIIRNKWVALTPEEYVRQRFVEWLVSNKGYSKYRIANEIGLTVNRRSRRCDTVVFTADNKPYIIVEYKAPQIKITQKVFDQIVRYNSVLFAKYLIVTNGVTNYCCEMDYENNTYRFLKDLPQCK